MNKIVILLFHCSDQKENIGATSHYVTEELDEGLIIERWFTIIRPLFFPKLIFWPYF